MAIDIGIHELPNDVKPYSIDWEKIDEKEVLGE